MDLPELLAKIGESDDCPPAPPIFESEVVPGDWWSQHFKGCSDGVDAWHRLVESCSENTRSSPVVTRESWEELLDFEVTRRGRAIWSLDHHPDGSPRDERERSELRHAHWSACHDFWFWLGECGWVENPHASKAERRNMPFVNWPSQVAYMWWLLRSLKEGQDSGEQVNRLINKTRAAGVTWACCHILLWHVLFTDNFTAKIGSLTAREMDDKTTYSLMGKIVYIAGRQPSHHLPCYDLRFERFEEATAQIQGLYRNHVNNSTIRGQTMTANFGRSGREAIVWVDEFAGVQPTIQRQIRTAMTSVAVASWSTSTPKGRGNQWYDEVASAPSDTLLELGWTCDPRRDQEWFDGLLIENGGDLTRDQRAQEYDCDFAGISGTRIWGFDRVLHGFEDDDPVWESVRDRAERYWLQIGGMDFGYGTSPSAYIGGLVDWEDAQPHAKFGLLPRIWWVDEVVVRQVKALELSEQIAETRKPYRGTWRVYGDPSGKTQGGPSWEADLNENGVPVVCLDSMFRDPYVIHESLDLIDEMMRLGLWKVHLRRCSTAVDSMEQWEWDLPAGISPDRFNRAMVKWKKDYWSHMCEAAMYAAMAVIRYHQPHSNQESGDLSSIPDAVGGRLRRAFK